MSKSGLLPFFTFYGGKFRVAPKYQPPQHSVLIEPFAGSAGYSLRYPAHEVRLSDVDSNIVQTWDYLIRTPESEILALPDITEGQTVDDLAIPPEARLLIGWWLNKGSAQPKRQPSSFMLNHPKGAPYWGESIRQRIAQQQSFIRHWTIRQASYADLDNAEGTWFVDPPYEIAGKHYRFGADGIDFTHLADWCRSRQGQVIVCEADDATWLPFRPLAAMHGTEGKQKVTRSRIETVWTNRCPDCWGEPWECPHSALPEAAAA